VSRSLVGTNVDGKKKVMKNQRRSKEKDGQEKEILVARSGVGMFGWQG
jgi:hypothetical protein